MSRLQCPSQLLRAVLRVPLPRPSPASPSPSPHVLLPPAPARRAFSQTCRRRAEGEGNNNPAAPSSSTAPQQPTTAPFRPPAPPPPRVSIFAPTPTAALPDSAGYRAEAPAPSTPPGPSPLPRTFSWHAAQTDRAITPMPEMAALVKDAARPGLGRSGDGLISPSLLGSRGADEHREPFHLHIFAHRHNTHVTLSRPNRDAIISVSCGNLGFRKSKRKHYDAAYQLTQHVLQLIEKKQLLEHIHGIEVILSGFGQGREAAAKVLLSSEGSRVKEKIVRVSDASKIKFGGTRSRNPRRV